MSTIEEFLKFEKINSLFEQKAQGISYWLYLRVSLYDEINNQNNKTGQAHTEYSDLSLAKQVVRFLKLVHGAIFHNPLWFLRKKDVLVMNHARRSKTGNYYEALYTDRLLPVLPYSYSVLENPYQGYHSRPILTKNIRYKDYIDIAQELTKTIYYRPFHRHQITRQEMANLSVILKNIEEVFEVELPLLTWQKKLQTIIWNYKVHQKYFKKIITRINPKIIIEVVSYSINRGVMNELAAERGIPTVELQHGTMGDGHIAYNFLDAPKIPSFPDYLFLFGAFWKETTRFPIPTEKIIVTGSPYFEERLAKYMQMKITPGTKKIILFISQGTIGLELSQKATELSDLIDPNKFKIKYKLHPGEYADWGNRYPGLASSSVEVVSTNSTKSNNLYDLFNEADYLVGVYSTAILEGIVLCPNVFIFDLFGHEHMHQLYENGYAKLVSEASEIFKTLTDEKIEANSRDMHESFWSKNSRDKITEAIIKIVNN